MKLTHYLYISAALALLSACSEEEAVTPVYTVGETDNAIVLRAGISQGGFSGVATRAGVEEHHGNHVAMKENTVMRLQVIGEWWKSAGATSGDQVVSVSLGTAGDIVEGYNTHRHLSLSPALNWDDYGTADPNNKGTDESPRGRLKGLSIYGVTVDGVTSSDALPDAIKGLSSSAAWTTINWGVPVNQADGWSANDLLISNNVKDGGEDDTYKFDEKSDGKLLEFKHAMSKITVNLIAGEGFPTAGGVGSTAKKFANVPDVILTSNLYNETSATEWAYTKGAVNITTGEVSGLGEASPITMKTLKTDDTGFTVIKDALIMPGSAFADATSGEYPVVLSILADGNRYYVTSQKIRAAIAEAIAAGTHKNSYVAEPGKNYIFKIIINKTSIDVTATIKDWINVTAEDETPIINFSKCYGQTGTDFANDFDFYRSTTKTGSFISTGNHSEVSYNASTGGYSMTPQLYWPDHSTHYFFRGVWPKVGTTDGPVSENVKSNSIEVVNGPYTVGKYPSDLMIGMPRKADGTSDEYCKSTHNEGGICATDAAEGSSHENEGLIHMNFQYAMSQVIVKLVTTTGDDKVTINGNTKVEILNIFNAGEIKLSDGSSDFGTNTPTTLTLNNDNGITDRESNDYANYRNSIIPQNLTNTTGDLKFRITVKDDESTDVYETPLGIKNIKVVEGSNPAAIIDAWQPGKVYVYTLTLKKTAIEVSATIQNWVTVTANENVWF